MQRNPVPDTLAKLCALLGTQYDESRHAMQVLGSRAIRVDEAYVSVPVIPDVHARVLDIYGAQSAYLSQTRVSDKPPDFGRLPLTCECSETLCRQRFPDTRITAAAYREAQPEGEYRQRPHYRWEETHWHDASCRWIVAEMAARSEANRVHEAQEAAQLAQGAQLGSASRKRQDHAGEFIVRRAADEQDVLEGETLLDFAGVLTSHNYRRTLLDARAAMRTQNGRPNRSSYLREIVSSYERLKAEKRDAAAQLTIEGYTSSYAYWLQRIKSYRAGLTTQAKLRIWYGGASVRMLLDAYEFEFYDEVSLDAVLLKPLLNIPFTALHTHRRAAYLREAIREFEAKEADYITVYWYGTLSIRDGKIIADFDDDLNLLHLAPRRKRRRSP